MKALDERFLMMMFTLLLNRIHVFAIFMFNLNRETSALESIHLSGHIFRFRRTVQDLEVFLVWANSPLVVGGLTVHSQNKSEIPHAINAHACYLLHERMSGSVSVFTDTNFNFNSEFLLDLSVTYFSRNFWSPSVFVLNNAPDKQKEVSKCQCQFFSESIN